MSAFSSGRRPAQKRHCLPNQRSPSLDTCLARVLLNPGLILRCGTLTRFSKWRRTNRSTSRPALAVSAAFGGVTAVRALMFELHMRFDNRRRNREQGLPRGYGSVDVPTELLSKGPKDSSFRYLH